MGCLITPITIIQFSFLLLNGTRARDDIIVFDKATDSQELYDNLNVGKNVSTAHKAAIIQLIITHWDCFFVLSEHVVQFSTTNSLLTLVAHLPYAVDVLSMVHMRSLLSWTRLIHSWRVIGLKMWWCMGEYDIFSGETTSGTCRGH